VSDRPSHLVITMSDRTQDARDLHREFKLVCAGCGASNRQVASWVLPGLCSDCAIFVESVTVAAPRVPVQSLMFDLSRRPQ
jgi:hypothetical protein